MTLIGERCTLEGYGRPVQPALTNRSKRWVMATFRRTAQKPMHDENHHLEQSFNFNKLVTDENPREILGAIFYCDIPLAPARPWKSEIGNLLAGKG
jgi:hypothetical protein